jgi:nitroimidazol reductase NimA-like FMN-containing flavoprotein (pyridoxamine 5'-phosphate oxidase superfamily)
MLVLLKYKAMFGILDNSKIEKVIKENVIGRIGCYGDGKMYILPLSYAYDGKCIYAHSPEGLKISIMRKNPTICFQVDTMKDMADWESVLLWGTFEELTKEEDKKVAVESLMNRKLPLVSSETVKLSPEWPFRTGDYSTISGIIFKINITEKTGRYEELEVRGGEIKYGKVHSR